METESTYPNPPEYYKDFKTPGFHLEPPKPIEGEYWNNGVIRSVNTPIIDYVDRVYPFLYDPKSLDIDKNTKAEIIKKLLRRLIKAYITLLKKSNSISQDEIQPYLQEIECVSMNIVRLLNKMREYQFRENIIRSLKNQIQEKESRLEELNTKIEQSKQQITECIETMKNSQSTTQEEITSIFIQDLEDLLRGEYKRTEEEEKEEEKEEQQEEEEKEEVPVPHQDGFVFLPNANDTADHLSTISFETELTGIGIFIVLYNKQSYNIFVILIVLKISLIISNFFGSNSVIISII